MHLLEAGLDRSANADGSITSVASHGIARTITSRVVAVIIDFDQRDDRAARPVLRDEVNNFLGKRIAIGVSGFAQWVCGGLEQRTHRDLGMNAAMGRARSKAISIAASRLVRKGFETGFGAVLRPAKAFSSPNPTTSRLAFRSWFHP